MMRLTDIRICQNKRYQFLGKHNKVEIEKVIS